MKPGSKNLMIFPIAILILFGGYHSARAHTVPSRMHLLMEQLTGVVVDQSGAPVAGVTVEIKGTAKATLTNQAGSFVLTDVPDDAVIVFSAIGYETIEMAINGRSDIKVQMIQTSVMLEQVVIGYGTQKRENVTSAVSTVRMDDIDKGATSNAIKMLQGKAAGVNISSTSGIPGDKPLVLVRGIGSVSGSSQPLYVLDGIPMEEFPDVNPDDIETIEVLKDAASAAIYGSRGNNGVVMITTKSGRVGKTKVNLSGQYGIGEIYHDIKVANATQYINVMQKAFDNYNEEMGTNLSFYIPPTIEETNWVKEISRRSAPTSSANASVSGGDDKTKFFTSIGFFDTKGILKTSGYDRFNVRANFSHKISDIFTLKLNLAGSFVTDNKTEEAEHGLKPLRNAREEQPWYSPYFADGSYKNNGAPIVRHNPVMELLEDHWRVNTYGGMGNLSLDVRPFKGLTYTPSIKASGDFIDDRKKITDKMTARRYNAEWGALRRGRNTRTRYVIDNIVAYEGEINDLEYTAMAGHSYEKSAEDLFGFYSSNYLNNAYPSSNLNMIDAGAGVFADPLANDFQSYSIASLIGRIETNYKKKYILNASIRRDGSSRFSKEKQYGVFPSVSLGWQLSNEKFWNVNENFISNLRVRASYGVTGSMDGIGNYAHLSLAGATDAYNGQGALSLRQNAQLLTWEKDKEFDAGVDIEMVNRRVNLTVDYYRKKTTDLLFNRPVQATSGYTTLPSNIGALANNGLEITASARVLTGELKWNLGANISFIKNKMTKLYDGLDMYIVPSEDYEQLGNQMHALIVGKPISSFYLIKMVGIYQDDKDVPTKLYDKGVRAGDVKYADINGDGDISPADRMYVGKAIPDYYGGITNNLRWKNFELNIFSQFSVGSKLLASWRGVNNEGAENLGDGLVNVRLEDGTTVQQVFNVSEKAATTYWDGPGTSNSMPRPILSGVFSGYSYNYNLMTSSRQLEDASYFKIKELTLAYNLSLKNVVSLLNEARIYFTVSNAFTFTKYSGYDPEQTYSLIPGASNYGVDFGMQGLLRIYTLGVNLSL